MLNKPEPEPERVERVVDQRSDQIERDVRRLQQYRGAMEQIIDCMLAGDLEQAAQFAFEHYSTLQRLGLRYNIAEFVCECTKLDGALTNHLLDYGYHYNSECIRSGGRTLEFKWAKDVEEPIVYHVSFHNCGGFHRFTFRKKQDT
jgi:hypothetical protein